MKKMKFLALLIAIVMSLGLVAACGPAEAPPAGPAAPGTSPSPGAPPAAPSPAQPALPEIPEGARVADHIEFTQDNAAIGVINPFAPGGGGGMVWKVYTMIYDRLIYRVEGGSEFAPMLATSWETDDWQTFVFHLREDVYFSNGEKFNAESVIWNIEYGWANPGTEAGNIWGRIDSVRALGPYSIEMVTTFIDVDIFFEISLPPAGMISPRAVRENPETGVWIGTGPWLVTGFATSNFVELARNEDHWGEIPPTKTIATRFIPEPAARMMMLQNGESHFSFGINAEDVVSFMNDPVFDVYPVHTHHINGIWFNMNNPITGDYNFRMAVAHAIDHAEIALIAADIWADPVTGGAIWGRGTQFRDNSIPNRERNLDLAREYLAASPYNGEELEIATAILTLIRGSEALQQQLAQIGINTRINSTDIAGINSIISYGNPDIDIIFYLMALRGNAGSIRGFFYPHGFRNGSSYNNPRVTEILDLAQEEGNLAARQALYFEMQAIMNEDPPVIPVFWRVNANVGLRSIGGFYLTADNTHNFRNVFMVLDD
jgi:peptide/nickel transport system substrate-binding protein